MEQYVKYLRKSRLDRDYAEQSVEETLKRHEKILDDLASSRGYYIAKTYHEVVSGDSIAARPEIRKMLEEVAAGIYAGVLVVDVERLARGNSADQAYISQIFQFTGTKIITPNKTYDPSNEFDEEYFEFGLFMSRREYKTINRRLVRGRDSSAREGKYISSVAPYGYERVKLPDEKGFTLAPHPREALVVEKIFDMYVHYCGTKNIANYLNDSGVPTRHGNLWTYSTIAQIVTNPVYMGKIRRGWSRQIKSMENGVVKKHIRRAKNMDDYSLYDGLHPALVSEETFMQAQTVRYTRQAAPRVKEDFALKNAFAGLIFCSVCGKRIGRTINRNRPRLRCVNGRNCHNVSADYYEVESKILSALGSWLDGYKVRIDTLDFTDEVKAYNAQIGRLRQAAERLDEQLDHAYNLVEQGVYTAFEFQERRDKITAEQSRLQREREDLAAALAALEERSRNETALVPHTEALLESYDAMSMAERNALLKGVLRRIEYRKEADGTITIDLFPRLPPKEKDVGINH